MFCRRDTSTTEIYSLSLHDALPILRLVLGGVDSVRDISVVQTLLRQAIVAARQYADPAWRPEGLAFIAAALRSLSASAPAGSRSEEHTSELQSQIHLVCRLLLEKKK